MQNRINSESRPIGEYFDVSAVHIRSRLLRYENGVIYIIKAGARSDEAGEAQIDLRNFHLPATHIAKACCLAEDAEAVSVMLLMLDKYLCSKKNSMKYHRTAANWAAVVAKVFEFCRVNNVYSPRQLSQEHFLDLAEKIAVGGWANALRLKDRCEELLKNHIEVKIFRGELLVFGSEFRRLLRTSCTGRELNCIRPIVAHIALGIEVSSETKVERYTTSLLRQLFSVVNDLASVRDDLAVSFTPYVDVLRLAKKLGRETASTENLQIETAAPLLTHSMNWIYKQGSQVIELLDSAYREKNLFSALKTDISNDFIDSQVSLLLPELSGLSLAELRENDALARNEFNRVVRSFVTSCFIIIAVMNARRKDEVLHRRFGVHESCAWVESTEHKIFRCRFYVEKSLRDYDEFYVNQSTFKAIALLSELQAVVRKHTGIELAEDATENTLFRFPRMTRGGILKGNDWYIFEGNTSQTNDFVKRALNTDVEVRITPHMFRRFYAVLFMYRFEDASLMALSQDLGHFDLEMTRQYVLDTVNTPVSKRIPANFQVRLLARENHRNDIELALQEVGQEKLIGVVDAILQGAGCSGGFERLVRRVHNKLAAKVDYRIASVRDQAKLLGKKLIERGHEPRPFVHGDCMAGTVSKRRLAQCRNEVTGELDHARARPKVCRNCAYHHVSEGYLQSLTMLADDLKQDIMFAGSESLRGQTLLKEHGQVEVVLAYHSQKILG